MARRRRTGYDTSALRVESFTAIALARVYRCCRTIPHFSIWKLAFREQPWWTRGSTLALTEDTMITRFVPGLLVLSLARVCLGDDHNKCPSGEITLPVAALMASSGPAMTQFKKDEPKADPKNF